MGKPIVEGLAFMCALRTGFPEHYRDGVLTTASQNFLNKENTNHVCY